MKTLACTIILLVFFAPALVSHAADHENLEDGLPVQVEDAYATAYGNREVQFYTRYDRTDDDENLFSFVPRLEYGFAMNSQLTLEVPVLAGTGDRTGSGDIRISALHNFNAASLFLPAFALAGGFDIPTGRNTEGLDTRLKFIASKMICPYASWLHRLHFNFEWKHNSGKERDERANLYTAILGFSSRIGKDTTLVADLLRQQEREKHQESNIFELGFRRQLTPLTLVVLGSGFGLGDESPDFRVTLGFQHSF